MAVSSVRFVFVFVCLLASYAQVQEVIAQGIVSIRCLQCICEVTSGCGAVEQKCSTSSCGPYHITEPFWRDSGKPGYDRNTTDEGFSKCSSDTSCATKIVQGYMQRHAHDCNGDGEIDCNDYVRLHLFGAAGCISGSMVNYNKKYNTCMSSGIGPDDEEIQPTA